MTQTLITTSSASTLAKLKKLLGPPPILSSEDPKIYDALLAEIIESVGPSHFIVQMLVKNLADVTWEITRISRHKAMVIEGQYRLRQEMEEKRRQREEYDELEEDAEADTAEPSEACAEQSEQAEQADDPTKQVEHNGQADPEGQADRVAQVEQAVEGGAPTTQLDRMFELEAVVDTAVADCDEIILGPDDDRDELNYVAALRDSFKYYEQLDHFVDRLMARRNELLEQIDTLVQGLGQRFRRASDHIIEAEFTEAKQEAPSITSPGGDAQ
jgi:hypothetical protein